MSLTKDVKFDAQKMHFEGFIDYGQEEIKDNNTEFTDQIADHALVFIFRPCRSSWIQLFAVFPTKGAVPGHVISRLLAKAILVLKVVFARVTSVTCDGAQTKKRAWADCGISGKGGKDGKISCSMEHPTRREDMVSLRCSALVQVCEKSHRLPEKDGETSTEDTSKRKRHGKHQRSGA
jgi:hypothetical protein